MDAFRPHIPRCEKIDLSNSSANRFLWCPKAYYWRYVRGWSGASRSSALEIGLLFHTGLERAYEVGYTARNLKAEVMTTILKKEEDEGIKLEAKSVAIACFLVEKYCAHYAEDNVQILHNEVTFRMPIDTEAR